LLWATLQEAGELNWTLTAYYTSTWSRKRSSRHCRVWWVAQACKPSYLGGENPEDHSLRTA
jgi:hypothetical protein